MAIAATYTYDPSSVDARKARLAEHLAFIQGLEDSGKLLAVGRLADASVDILFLLQAENAHEARTLLQQDPYHRAGFISEIAAYGWAPTRGSLAPL